MEHEIGYASSIRHRNKFVNPLPTPMGMGFRSAMSLLREYSRKAPGRKPAMPIPMEWVSPEPFPDERPAAYWFGHSTLLLQLGGKRILVDPMLGPTPSPVSFIGTKRYSEQPPMPAEALPPLDLVLVTHDHYDHLDAKTVRRISRRTKQFLVPIGVGAHLRKWGVDSERIREFDWWDEHEVEGLRFACTPARHFSGRGLLNRDSTLWCSWVLESEGIKLFLSGDSGYGPHFRAIGARYGPFDVSFIECGQYNERWAGIHMMPEETVQAGVDVGTRVLIPIHWAAFTLALHDWTDPVERALRAAKERGVLLSTPKIGESFRLDGQSFPTGTWWKALP